MMFRSMVKAFSKIVAVTAMAVVAAGAAKAEETVHYNMYLYFSEGQPYIDELTLKFGENDHVTGHMHVPNDFDADIGPAIMTEGTLRFHLKLPAKYDEMFPGGLMYVLKFPEINPCPNSFCPSIFDINKFVGFIYSPDQTKHLGSVVGFPRPASSL